MRRAEEHTRAGPMIGAHAAAGVVLLTLLPGAPALAERAAILDIGPEATSSQIRAINEISERLGEPLEHDVLPPLRAFASMRDGSHQIAGYIKPESLQRLSPGTRLSVPLHVSRRGLYLSEAEDAPDGIVLLRGYKYDPQTWTLIEQHEVTVVNDHASAIDMLVGGRLRYAVLDEFIFEKAYTGHGIRKLRTVEDVTLHFGLAREYAGASGEDFDAAICQMWRDDTLYAIHQAFYPGFQGYRAARDSVAAGHCP